MDALEKDGLIAPGTRTDLLGNRLVMIAHKGTDGGADGQPAPVTLSPGLDLAALLGDGRLAVALTDAVPAGIYARAALTSLRLWEQAAPRLAQTDNVRAALRLVALGEAPYGIVYMPLTLGQRTGVGNRRYLPGDLPPAHRLPHSPDRRAGQSGWGRGNGLPGLVAGNRGGKDVPRPRLPAARRMTALPARIPARAKKLPAGNFFSRTPGGVRP